MGTAVSAMTALLMLLLLCSSVRLISALEVMAVSGHMEKRRSDVGVLAMVVPLKIPVSLPKRLPTIFLSHFGGDTLREKILS